MMPRKPHTYDLCPRVPVVEEVFWVLVFVGLLPLTALAQAGSDGDIERAVEQELASEGVRLESVSVSVRDGVVTLSGEVESLSARDLAERLTQSVPGVVGVVNRIEVAALDRSDEAIHEDIRSALRADPATESFEVTAIVEDGSVSLRGTVDSAQDKQLAELITRGVKGVRAITNHITVAESEGPRNDEAIEADVASRLRWDTRVDDALIAVSVKDGVVYLAGAVPSPREKTQAILLAHVDGAERVVASDLAVDIESDREEFREGKYTLKSDAEVEKAVERALRYDPRVRRFAVDIEVDRGTVTLRGQVDNLAAKMAAGEDAKNVVGVERVTNLISVDSGTMLEDREVQENVQRALTLDPLVDAESIEVSVVEGEARLSGTVSSRREAERAVSAAARARGVTSVDDRLEIGGPSTSG